MAKRKGTQSFAQVKGKIVDGVEIHTTDYGCAIGIMFRDRTYLCFEVETAVTVLPDLSDWKTKNYRPLKRWRPIST